MRYLAITLTLCIFLGILSIVPAIAEESKTDAILMYQTEKKGPWVAVVAAWFIPTLGHVYARSWWPRGAKFLAFYAGSIVLMANEETAPIGVLTLVGCRLWEYIDAYGAVKDFNSSLATKYGIQLSFRDGPGIYLCYRF